MCRLADVAVACVQEQLSYVADISAHNSVDAALQIRGSNRMRFQERDGLMDGQIEIRTNRQAERSALRLGENGNFQSEKHISRRAARLYQPGERIKVVIPCRAGKRAGRCGRIA